MEIKYCHYSITNIFQNFIKIIFILADCLWFQVYLFVDKTLFYIYLLILSSVCVSLNFIFILILIFVNCSFNYLFFFSLKIFYFPIYRNYYLCLLKSFNYLNFSNHRCKMSLSFIQVKLIDFTSICPI